MAKLGTYYGLCPIIDHRSLLGITPDEENGIVIVTLGKNIAIKYKLLDQKQIHSWRTKEKFTSPIIFDRSQQKYVAVFNQSYLRTWTGNEEFLDKLKKYKLSEKIYTIFECNSKTFVLFSNGAVVLLSYALENRKNFNPEAVIDTSNSDIIDIVYANYNETVYVGLIVQKDGIKSLLWTKINESSSQQKFQTLDLSRGEAELSGYLIHVTKASVNFLALWSDGRLFSTALITPEEPSELLTVIEAISCKQHVSALSLDENYIALYGCNSNEEGALLLIYNTQFQVVQSRQPFKLFTLGARLFRSESNLLLPVGQNLAVVPFHLHTEQLAALVGSHKVATDPDSDVAIVHKLEKVEWKKGKPQQHSTQIPQSVNKLIGDLLDQGLPENLIFSKIMPDLVEKNKVEAIRDCLEFFCDVAEEWLVKLMKFVLTSHSKIFKKTDLIQDKNFPKELQPVERVELLDLILKKSFNENLLLPHLRREISVAEAVLLLKYICFLLCGDNEMKLSGLDSVQSENKLIEWGCVILDSNYQKFILARDDTINEVLNEFSNLVESELNGMKELKQVLPLVVELNQRKSVYKMVASDIHYSIEELTLY